MFNNAREQEVSLDLEMAAKRNSTPSNPISNPEINYNTPSGSASREAREQKETAKRKTLLRASVL